MMHYPYQLIPKEGTVFHERGEQLWRTAEKYQGTMDFKVKDGVFILSVMMKDERREEDGFRSDR